MPQPNQFDLKVVLDHFESSLRKPDDVEMDLYLLGYKELNKFFQLMGTVFGFVSSDVKTKIEILEDFRLSSNEAAEKFQTFNAMMEYEKTTGLLNKSDYVSGSRTLLRLHRGLDFIREFLRALGELDASEKTGSCCQTAYNQTLAHFHPWLVRKGAVMAMYTMPTKDQLLNRVCSDVVQAMEILPSMLNVTQQVYDRTHKLYNDFDLHALS